MQKIGESAVIADWLEKELEKDRKSPFEIGEDHTSREHEKFAQLLAQKPGSARVFLNYNLRWCQTTLSEEEFRNLKVIWGENRTAIKNAQDILNGESSLLPAQKDHIQEIANNYEQYPERWVLNRRRKPGSGPFLQDGNHRAVATALRLLQGHGFSEKMVYIGYPSLDTFGYTGEVRRQIHLKAGSI